MPTTRRLLLLISAGALLVAACSAGGAPSASPPAGTPSSEPSGTPVAGLEHPTGAEDVVLRYEQGGGFVMPEWAVTQAPIFTLYGDGTVVFRDPSEAPPPSEDGVMRNPAFRTAELSEEQVQALLEFAANEGALGVARDHYPYDGVADAGTAVFTINAGGREKQVSVYALGIEDPNTPDAVIRRRFLALAERLGKFDEGGDIPTEEYVPRAWRGILMESQGGMVAESHPWPWDDIEPADFSVAADPNGPTFPVRELTAEELAALDLGELGGGAHGIYLEGPDGKTYSLALRPLLPGESV